MSKNPLTRLSLLLLSLNPYEFATFAYVIGIIASEGLDSDAQGSLGNFYNLVGETIQTIGAQSQYLNSTNTQTPDVSDTIQMLKSKIGNIEDFIKKFKEL
ncbi:MAG: hypothetical protein K2K15_02615 [Anaeroplasmataceae bacterium]|nr:hypothetical protein [Anaeroplasmataceae bacterium]